MEFIYESFDIKGDRIVFHFTMGDYHFAPEWRLIFELPAANPAVRRAVFNLGMAELVSYWKACCPKEIIIRAGYLSEDQRAWWKKLYLGGLGEFFYRNGITPNDEAMHISCECETCECDEKPLCKAKNTGDTRSGILIPVGGGKDSAVTMMKLGSENNRAFCINPSESAVATARVAGFADADILTARRTIDPLLLELNRRGALNGHTPFSAVVAFSSFLTALVMNKRYIALSNESSADESYVPGRDVNHQYSKGTGFEKDFRDYIAEDFSDSAVPEYFSFLRPYNEWRIAEIFVTDKRFLPVFLSCNLGAKHNHWCGKCAKCLYTYALLAAFLPDEALIPVFGRNLLDGESFIGMFAALLDPQKDKPWECVGTRSEINHAVFAARRLRLNRGEKLPFLLRQFAGAEDKATECYFNDNHCVPDEFLHLLPR
jgi:hypothetical protein